MLRFDLALSCSSSSEPWGPEGLRALTQAGFVGIASVSVEGFVLDDCLAEISRVKKTIRDTSKSYKMHMPSDLKL